MQEESQLAAVDIVLTWVDGADPAWIRSRARYYWGQNSRHRWTDSGELIRAISSISQYATWVNRVFVVHADSQIPPAVHTQVTPIPHSAIIPEDHLPTFCSCSIEAYIHRIPGLSECFLYANDDVFLTQETSREEFFVGMQNKVYISSCRTKQISPADRIADHSVVRLLKALSAARQGEPSALSYLARVRRFLEVALWRNGLYNADQLLLTKSAERRYPPLHGVFALRKSVCEELWQVFEVELAQSTLSKFRTSTDIAFLNYLALYWGVYNGSSVLVDLPEAKFSFMSCE
jgi:hypothetical protein